jgi:hypothetical protein
MTEMSMLSDQNKRKTTLRVVSSARRLATKKFSYTATK